MMLPLWFLNANAADLMVTDIDVDCFTVTVTVSNLSARSAPAFFIDVFRDEPGPPPMGSIGEQFARVPYLPPWGRASRSFSFFESGWEGWIDVLLDTGEDVDEIYEFNNHEALFASFVCHEG